ncbi:MAG: hypothetical protein ABSH49_15365 [Bryobacteraceae bacterium]|jgi:hypothetical protein
MPKKNPLAVPLPKFFGKSYPDIQEAWQREKRNNRNCTLIEFLETLQEPYKCDPELWDTMRQWWPVWVLRRAAERNDAEAYKKVLLYILTALNAPPPDGVLKPRAEPGAPRKAITDLIVAKWKELDRPFLSQQKLARAVYRDAFTQADSAGKNKMVNRCRRAVERQIPRDQIPRPIRANKNTRPNL